MHRPDAATRRFYRLFYQWSVVTHHAASRQATFRAARASAFHTTTRMKDGHDEASRALSGPTIRRHTARFRRAGPEPPANPFEGTAKAGPGRRSRRREWWREHAEARKAQSSSQSGTPFRPTRLRKLLDDTPVQSPAERPFSEMSPGDLVVRYRSENSVMLELVFSGDVLQRLQKEFGHQLEKLGGHGKARVDLQALNRMIHVSQGSRPQNIAHSVLVTGTSDQVSNVMAATTTMLKNGVDVNVSRRWICGPVEPAAVRPFSSMALGEAVVRFRSESTWVVESAAMGPLLQTLEERYGPNLNKLAVRQGATIELQRAKDGSFPTVTSMLISGPLDSVHDAWTTCDGYLKAFQKGSGEAASARTLDSRSLKPLESVDRQNAKNGKYLELSLSEKQWIHIAATSDILAIAEKNSATVTIGEPEQRPRAEGVPGTELARSILISGSPAGIQATRQDVLSTVREIFENTPPSNQQQALETGRGQESAAKLATATQKRQQASEGKPANNEETSPHAAVAEGVRKLMRTLTHPAVVITSSSAVKTMSPEDRIKTFRGATVSSLTTVALHPKPVISFNLKVPSRSWDAIQASKRLGIHIPVASEQGAAFANMFTGSHDDPSQPFRELRAKGLFVGVGLGYPLQAPMINYSAVLFYLKAQLLPDKCVEVGDHVIVVAEVLQCKRQSGFDASHKLGEEPIGLSYGQRGYRGPGGDIKPSELIGHVHRAPENALHPEAAKATKPVSSGNGLPDTTQTTSPNPPNTTFTIRKIGQDGAPAEAGNRPHEQFTPLRSELDSPNSDRQTKSRSALDGKFGPGPVNDSLYEAMRAARDADQSGEDIDALKIMNDIDKAMGLDSQGQDHRHDFHTPRADAIRNHESTGHRGKSFEGPLWGPAEVARDDSARIAAKESPARADRQAREFSSLVDISGSEQSDHMDMERAASQDSQPGAAENTQNLHRPPPQSSNAEQSLPNEASRSNYWSEAQEPLWEQEDVSREESSRLAAKEAPGDQASSETSSMAGGSTAAPSDTTSASTLKGSAWGLGSLFKRSLSTTTRAASTCPPNVRSFSFSAVHSNANQKEDSTQSIDPSTRHTTVADFLGLPDDDTNLPTHRLRDAVRMKNAALDARLKLEEEAEDLTDEEKAELEHTILRNDRIVSKKLAWNAADDLRIMLDKGRVDFKRAQFMESTIEKGQAVLLEEAKYVRGLLDKGKINWEKFQKIKERLESMNGVLITETNRLRQFVDEEGEGEMYYQQKGE